MPGYCLGYFKIIISVNPHSDPIRWLTFSVHFTDEKLRLRKVKQLACNHTAGTWQRHVQTQGLKLLY